MFPNVFNVAPNLGPKSLNPQQGFLLPLALFILVVMGLLALTISRTAIQSQTSGVQELISLQSFYAAESGAQRGMQALFLGVTSRQATDSACANLALNHDFAGVDGLSLCRAQVSCSCRYQTGTSCAPAVLDNYAATASADLLKSFYTLTSVGSCGHGQYRAVRTIQAGAFVEQEP